LIQGGLSHRISKLRETAMDAMNAFFCPACRGGLRSRDAAWACDACGRSFGAEGGVATLYHPNEWSAAAPDVTDDIRSFYESTPFPNYEELDTVWRLKEKAEKGVFARLLDEQIAADARILEAGCGTGQLSNFLGIRAARTVFGTDLCLNSLKLAEAFRARNGLDNVRFLQMNLFRPVFAQDSFDVVVCNGVLHHTSDPLLGFRTLAGLLKPGGAVIIGLYNRWGRLSTDVRRRFFRLSGGRFQRLDPRIRKDPTSALRQRTWFLDQYENPHESKHTIGEVQRWFERAGVRFLSSIPKAVAFESFSAEEKLFEPHARGSRLDHALVQLGMIFSGGREGGLFVMIGRRLGPADGRP
jgi:SAM-dependent methyltransferase